MKETLKVQNLSNNIIIKEADITIFDNISFSVKLKGLVAIMGPSEVVKVHC